MGKVFDSINPTIREFIQRQQMFFVATAPLANDGHVNLSPKGLDSFRILDDHTVAYADLIGSGIETVAHLRENGRIVLMFCAFEGPPKIVRLHGVGTVISSEDGNFNTLAGLFPPLNGLRGFVRVRCTRISDSCGFGVPLFDFKGQRSQLPKWADNKTPEEQTDYVREKNAFSVDALPGAVLGDHASSE